MRVPRRFFWGIAAGLLVACAVYVQMIRLQFDVPTDDSNWLYGILTRKFEICAHMPHPKLVLVGGSSTFFGLSARQIEDTLHIPTLNMGLGVSMGLPYMLNLTRKAAAPGDTVLLAFEYELYFRGNDLRHWADHGFVSYLCARDSQYFRQLPLLDQARLTLGLPMRRLRTGIERHFHPRPATVYQQYSAYDIAAVDDRGDVTGHTANRRPFLTPDKVFAVEAFTKGLPSQATGFDVLAQFFAWAKEHNIRVLATYPPVYKLPQYDGPITQTSLRVIQNFYHQHHVPLLGNPQNNFYPGDHFFDTGYHLTQEAAHRHTDAVIQLLSPHLNPDDFSSVRISAAAR
jgi:hypothetical protein